MAKITAETSFRVFMGTMVVIQEPIKMPKPSTRRKARSSYHDLLIFESATAVETVPSLGVKNGDRFLSMWSNFSGSVKVGDKVQI